MPRQKQVRFILGGLLLVVLWTSGIANAASQESHSSSHMTLMQAFILGAVEGLTEYLPVSSTGHLLVTERLMGMGKPGSGSSTEDERAKEAFDAYTICIQAGAILAVLGLYAGRVRQMIRGLMGKDSVGLRMLINLVAAFVPAAVVGLLFNKAIKAYLFGIWPVVAAWFVGGIAILAASWTKRAGGHGAVRGAPLESLQGRMALVIGIMQCIAMWPGVSRSLITIVGGLVVGLSLPAAVEFSFLLGLVTLSAATLYDALKHGQLMLQMFDVVSLSAGLAFAFLFAVISVKWMVAYLKRHSLAVFGYYRVLAAIGAAALILAGVI